MATQDDVRGIALALPEVAETTDRFGFTVRGKAFAWVWLDRPDPKKGRVPNPEALGIRVRNELEKQDLVALDPAVFFTEPHYNGFPAILVRLAAIELEVLERLLVEGWRIQAPKRLVRAWEAEPR